MSTIPPDLKAIHGFFMLGTNQLILYHSAMFHIPAHAFQMIFIATLPDDAMEAYRRDVAAHPHDPGSPGAQWLIHNEKGNEFALQQIYDGEITSFQTQIKRLQPNGEYARDPVVANTTVTVGQMIYFRQFNPEEPFTPGPESPYIVFGGAEWFVAHRLTKDPDYDVVASMTWADTGLADAFGQIENPQEILLEIGHSDGPPLPGASPLVAGRRYPTQVIVTQPPKFEHHMRPPKLLPATVQVDSIYWFDNQGINSQS
jgi:hypothetical protein